MTENMTDVHIKGLLKKLVTDPKFLHSVEAAKTGAEKRKVVMGAGITINFGPNDVLAELKKLQKTAPAGSPLAHAGFGTAPVSPDRAVDWVIAVGTWVGAIAIAAVA